MVATEKGLCLVSDSMRIAGTTQAGSAETAAVIRVVLSRRAISEWCDIFSEDGKIYLYGAQWHDALLFSVNRQCWLQPAGGEEDLAQLTKKTEESTDGYSDVAQVDGQETLRVFCAVWEVGAFG